MRDEWKKGKEVFGELHILDRHLHAYCYEQGVLLPVNSPTTAKCVSPFVRLFFRFFWTFLALFSSHSPPFPLCPLRPPLLCKPRQSALRLAAASHYLSPDLGVAVIQLHLHNEHVSNVCSARLLELSRSTLTAERDKRIIDWDCWHLLSWLPDLVILLSSLRELLNSNSQNIQCSSDADWNLLVMLLRKSVEGTLVASTWIGGNLHSACCCTFPVDVN